MNGDGESAADLIAPRPAPGPGEGPSDRRLLAPVDLVLAAASGLLAGVIYWWGAAPGVLLGDGGELQFAAWTAGLPHPTGYPLYMIMGWFWSHLLAATGLATPARAMNLLSVLFAALAVGLTYLLAHALIELATPRAPAVIQRLAALTAALAFAFTPTFWSQAVVTEVYPLHAAFLALLLGLALRWYKQVQVEQGNAEGTTEGAVKRRWPAPALMALALALGLSLTHHLSTVLLVPMLILFVWRQDGYRLRRPSWLLVLALLALVPLFLYLYVPLRAPATDYLSMELSPGEVLELVDRSPRGLVAYVLGLRFSGEIEGIVPTAASMTGLPARFVNELGWVGVSLAVLGLLILAARGHRRLLLLTGGSFLLLTAFNLVYTIEDIHVFYIPCYLIACCWIGLGVAFLAQQIYLLGRRWPNAARGALALAVGVALLALVAVPGSLFLAHAGRVDRSDDTGPERWWNQLLAADIAEGAVLVSNDRDEMMPMWYAQQVNGRRPDLSGIFPGMLAGEDWRNLGRVIDRALETDRPVYLIKPMPGVEIKARLGPSEDTGLTPVLASAAVGSPQRFQDEIFGEAVRLVGYDVAPLTVGAGEALQVDLYWQALQALPVDYTSFVHVRDGSGEKVAQSDKLVGGTYYPSTMWKPGEVLLDRHQISIPDDAPSGPYGLYAGMYELVGGEAELLGAAVLTGQVGGKAPNGLQSTRVGNAMFANFNDEILLVGYEIGDGDAGSFSGGAGNGGLLVERGQARLLVRLLWQAARPVAADYTVFIHLLNEEGLLVAQQDGQPFGGDYPTSVWQQGELLGGVYELSLPPELPAGTYRVIAGLYLEEGASAGRLPVFGEAGQRFDRDRVELGRIVVN